MIYLYKNGKKIETGNIPTRIYLNEDKEVIAKSFEHVDGYAKEIVACCSIFNEVVAKSMNQEYYHKLKDGASGHSVEDYDKVYNLDILKQKKCDEIDDKTDECIAKGFSYDDTIFSLSENAQTTWLGLVISKDSLSYPMPISTIDSGVYMLQDANSTAIFFGTGVQTIKHWYDTGRNLKLQVKDCQTKAEIDAIVDNR